MNPLNKAISLALPFIPKPIVRKVSQRYIAGATLDDAVRTVRALNSKGAMATVDVLGEFITTLDQARENTKNSCDVLRRLHHDSLKGNLSIKLTSLGLALDEGICEQHVREILVTARENGNQLVRMDMENSPYTDGTLNLYRKMRRDFANVGCVLQSYMRRTLSDIETLVTEGRKQGVATNVRLCKGIYVEPEAIAFQKRREVQENYLRALEALFAAGAYAGIATHDDVLIEGAKGLVRKYHLDNSQFEFQMLLGVREQVRDALIRDGYRLRVYVPFGEDWYGYSIRRLKENPKMGGYIVKALLTGK
ncbi:MAG: proline dehydrogenase family protein [Bacteroidota bacterium]|nr:proline dehydrogenase family protein [Bacteroidota bacterium]MDP4233638.1 proline dehydrogenase family protein [Bacteroidota bacterium]MDP4243102.1 proline dehydrogenase family protein [Bacteroidota bacterium]MDP4288452.1 proline dehydrogenase family protein [Bacteroidota bacterium]